MTSMPELKQRVRSLLQANRLQEAKRVLETIQSSGTPDWVCWHMLGTVHGMLGELAESEKCSRQVVALAPDAHEGHLNLANALLGLGRYDEAEACYKNALKINPSLPAAYQNMANIFLAKRDLKGAEAAYREVIRLQPDNAGANNGLATLLVSQGRDEEAVGYFKAALALNPGLDSAARHLRMLYGRTIPSWHFLMMNDEVRNSVYDAALRKVVTPESVVLDIGSGSGLLAMMAARAGAKHVYTCEVKKALADKAVEIIEINGYSDVITVINKKSTDMIMGKDMAEPADILVSEILDECLLGEGVIPSVHHARASLVKEGGCFIPRSAVVYAALVESKSLHEAYCVDLASGFDVSAFNEFSTAHYANLRLTSVPHRLVCKPVETFHFDLQNPDPQSTGEGVFQVTVDRDCICHAVVFWFSLDLDEEISISASPVNESGESHWMQALQVQNPPLTLKKGQDVRIRGKYDSMTVRFGIDKPGA